MQRSLFCCACNTHTHTHTYGARADSAGSKGGRSAHRGIIDGSGTQHEQYRAGESLVPQKLYVPRGNLPVLAAYAAYAVLGSTPEMHKK